MARGGQPGGRCWSGASSGAWAGQAFFPGSCGPVHGFWGSPGLTLAPTYTTEILPVAACYFDVDGTLVGTNLVHPTLYYLANQGTPLQSAVRLGRALLGAPRMALAELVDRRTFNELLFATYAGMSEDRLELLGEEAYRKVLLPSLYPSAKGLVAQSLAAGHDVVLVSGALECVIRHLARDLGATEVIANRLELKDGIATGKLLHPVVAGPEKARIVRDHARARGYDLDECYAFSDSYSDVPMLSVVGHPAVVNPDRRLSLLARAYSWPSFDLTRPT